MSGTERKLRINPNVVATTMADGAVLMDNATGECFELNRTGAQVWSGLARGEDPASIAASLVAQYALDPATISTDVETLVDALARRGILIVSR